MMLGTVYSNLGKPCYYLVLSRDASDLPNSNLHKILRSSEENQRVRKHKNKDAMKHMSVWHQSLVRM